MVATLHYFYLCCKQVLTIYVEWPILSPSSQIFRREMDKIALQEIIVGERFRKDLGDLASLTESIKTQGLLHPVVITPGHKLVAGERRLAAVKELGWTEIPVTIINVNDLLAAERDENAERKNFTPSEAVAIGRVIEARTKAVTEVARRKKIVDSKRGVFYPPSKHTRDVVADAVGMGETTFRHAKAIVNAAQTDLSQFGDLQAKMDETRNISGVHKELMRRTGKPSRSSVTRPGRHPVMSKMRHALPNREVERAVHSLDGICTVLEGVDIAQLEEEKLAEWSTAFKKIGSRIQSFSRRILDGK